MKIKSEPEPEPEYSVCNNDGGERSNDLDDFSLDNMMLRQIPSRCETKKRNHLNFVGLDKETVEMCSNVKQEFPNFQREDDEYDLEDSPPCRKSKLSKNINISDDDSLQLNRVCLAPIDVKVEVPESTNIHILKTDVPYPTREPQYCSLSEVSYDYMENFETKPDVGVSSCEIFQADSSYTIKEPEYCSLNEVSYEYRENFEIKFDEGVSTSETVGVHSPEMIKEPQSCSLNQVSGEYMENFETKFDEGVSTWETVGVHGPEVIKEPQSCSLNEVSDEYMKNFETKFDVGVSSWETVGVHGPTIKKEPQYSSLNEVSNEYMENSETELDVRVSNWESVQVHSPETVSNKYSNLSGYGEEDNMIHPLPCDASLELMSSTKDYSCDACDSCQNESPSSLIQSPETTTASGMETGVSFCPIKCSVSNGVSNESTLNVPEFGAKFSGCEAVEVDSPTMTTYQCSNLQEFEKKSYYVLPLAYSLPLESVSLTKDHCTDLHDSFKDNSSEHKMTSETGNSARAEVPEMNKDNCFQCLKNNNEDGAFSFDSRSTNDKSSNIRNIPTSPSSDNGLHWSSSCLNTERHSVLVSGDSSPSKKQSLSPAFIAANYFDVSGKTSESSGPQDSNQTKRRHHAERLLSRTKVIFPTSRERLCQAMGLTGLDKNKCHQCRGKLSFCKQADHRTSSVHGVDQFWRDGVTIKPKSIMRKAKQDRKGSPTKGILKVTYPSQCRSQSMIAFTQRQMQDFKSLATKLTTELKSMKDLVKGKFQSELEVSAATSAKENADEVRLAIENATKTEEMARRWLSMLARDCNRFCKIVRSNEDRTAAPERVIKKQRRVSFADVSS